MKGERDVTIGPKGDRKMELREMRKGCNKGKRIEQNLNRGERNRCGKNIKAAL